MALLQHSLTVPGNRSHPPESVPPLLSIVVPIFNEEECFPLLLERLLALQSRIGEVRLEIFFINDGSRDGTTNLLNAAAARHTNVRVVHFSRNFGHQAALTAGFDHARGDYVGVIDADLQDPPEVIPDMLALARSGIDVVYGQRRTRAGETWFKRATAAIFYRVLAAICRVEIPQNTGDFRLVTRRVAVAFCQLKETHRFIRGMVPWVGFSSAAFPYDRRERHAGVTKYPFMKMVRFAADAMLSFSNFPLRVSTYLGLGMLALSLLGMATVAYLRIFTNHTVPGISAVLFLVLLTSGVQFIILGIMGEYIGRIFEQSKGRPVYVIAMAHNLPVDPL